MWCVHLVSYSDKGELLSHVGNHLVAEEPNDAQELAEEPMSDVFANLVQASVNAAMRKSLILKSLKNSRQLSF